MLSKQEKQSLGEYFGSQPEVVAAFLFGSPLMKHRVARDGEILFARSNSDVAEFVIRVLHEYVDTKPLRDLQRQQLRRRIREQSGV